MWETFEGNYESGKYQFAMLACHMIYMSFVYFSVWQIKLSRPADFANTVIFQQKEKELLAASSGHARYAEIKALFDAFKAFYPQNGG